jgi:hypothetical protein
MILNKLGPFDGYNRGKAPGTLECLTIDFKWWPGAESHMIAQAFAPLHLTATF